MNPHIARTFTAIAALAAVLVITLIPIAAEEQYKKPPKEILDVLNAPVTPGVSLSPSRDYLLLVRTERYPPISELAEPMLKLAGLRINPRINGPHMGYPFIEFVFKRIADGVEAKVTGSTLSRMGTPEWSPDGKQIAFTKATETGVELWISDLSGRARKLNVTLNAAYGDAVQWMADSKTLLVQLIPSGRGKPPVAPTVPKGPNVQESFANAAPVRTYEDMLANPHDEDLFDYYATAQLAFLDTTSGRTTTIGQPALFRGLSVSPDGNYLLVTRIHRPYSYLHPHTAFPSSVEVWDKTARVVRSVVRRGLVEPPIGGVATGPRNIAWQPTEPSTLIWAEALDKGDPKTKVPHRDRVLRLTAPFAGEPSEIIKTEHRFRGLQWIANDSRAFLGDNDRDKRWNRTFLIDLANLQAEPRLVWSMSEQERYNDPGSPVTRALTGGYRAIQKNGEWIFLNGAGASPQGERPFLDRFSLTTLKAERLFQSDADAYETVSVLSDDGMKLLSRRESPKEPPNFFVRTVSAPGTSSRTPLTNFPDPAPQLQKIQKQVVRYKRKDGVDLSFTLFLPPDYRPGTPLPTVVWAYPTEYADASVAGQAAGADNRFTTIAGPSHLFFALMGYAVLDNASIPIIGDPQTVNNTYVQQLTMSAQAAIDKAVEMKVTDPNRVGVAGHSYGAFMTANLLAHTDLFRAGIARSGAYNRTLTPFGFQSERRTLWEADETYLQMSPFMFADHIKEPILLIHGEQDDNSGTFPIQSERMYQAVRGNSGTVRYVTLPHEAHGYAARESIEHVLYEQITWFEKYVRDAGAKSSPEPKK
jgi:dipeptidyl aminopeptidase/acylaminoacyl peptidase